MATKEEKRIEILKAAARIFSANGFEKAKVEDIAKVAGIGKGTVYEYFDSKKSLFKQMISFGLDQYRLSIKEIIEENLHIRARLVELAKYSAKYFNQHIDMIQMATQCNLLSNEMKQWLIEERLAVFELIEQMIDEGIKKGELRQNLNVELASFVIIGSIGEHFTKRVFFDGLNIEEVDFDEMVDVILDGLV